AAAGVVGLHVHWLAAGGVAYPSLAVAGWALLGAAVAPNSTTDPKPDRSWRTVALLTAAFLGWAGLTAWFTASLLGPYVQREQIYEPLRTNGRGSAEATFRRLREAAERLPGDQVGWVQLGAAHAARYTAEGDPADYAAAAAALEKAAALEPRRAETPRQLGALHAAAFKRTREPRTAAAALAAYDRMAALYPHSAERRWEYAEAALLIGAVETARREYAAALWLDQTPHPDKKLTAGQRRRAESFAPTAGK
ncbi:MAG: hypothetical protein ACRDD1_15320, partial [Planctomycetia bacterium]